MKLELTIDRFEGTKAVLKNEKRDYSLQEEFWYLAPRHSKDNNAILKGRQMVKQWDAPFPIQQLNSKASFMVFESIHNINLDGKYNPWY